MKKSTFSVWAVEREDVAYATAKSEDDADVNDKAYKLTDEQMEAIAERMGHYLQYDMDSYWEAVRDAYDDVTNRTFLRVK